MAQFNDAEMNAPLDAAEMALLVGPGKNNLMNQQSNDAQAAQGFHYSGEQQGQQVQNQNRGLDSTLFSAEAGQRATSQQNASDSTNSQDQRQADDSQGQQHQDSGTEYDGFTQDGVVYAEDLIPAENLESEFVFDFDEEARYRTFEDAKRGTQERLRYLKQTLAEKAELEERLRQTQAQEIAQRERAEAIAKLGKIEVVEEDLDRALAMRYLPDDLRDIDPTQFNKTVDDVVEAWDEFKNKFVSDSLDRDDYHDDREYQSAVWDAESEARKKWEAKRKRAEREISKTQNSELQVRYEKALEDSMLKLRRDRVEAAEARQKAMEMSKKREIESRKYLGESVTAANLGLTNAEDEYRAVEALKTAVPAFIGGQETEMPLSEVLVLVDSYFGRQAAELMVSGLRDKLGGIKQREIKRPEARPRYGRLPNSSARKTPARQPSSAELFREAGFTNQK